MNVEYRDIEGFPGYRVGDDGSVWSQWRRVAACTTKARGIGDTWTRLKERRQMQKSAIYVKVALYRDGKQQGIFIHKLVLNAFVGPAPEGMESRHKNDIHDDNRLENLCWGTRLENAADRRQNEGYRNNPRGEKHGMHKLIPSEVQEIKRRGATGERSKSIAASFGITRQNVYRILKGETWRSIAA